MPGAARTQKVASGSEQKRFTSNAISHTGEIPRFPPGACLVQAMPTTAAKHSPAVS